MVKKQSDKVDIVAVARAARVSASTVSRSYNHPELVNPATRKKIDRAVRKLGYIRNRAAQTMHGKRSATIGLIVPTINHAIFAEVIQAFSDSVEKEGFTILIASHGYDLEKEYAVMRKFLEHRVDGVALIGLEHAEETFQLLEQQEIPTIAMWNFDNDSRISCVGAKNLDAGALAAEHLVCYGHREIGLMFPPATGNDRAQGRLEGVMRVLQEAQITVPQEWQSEAPYSLTQAKQVCVDLLSQTTRPTALLCGNDILAQGAVFASQKLGLSVPDDISIIGIGDFKGSADLEPGLTTIRIPAQEIGRISGETICQLIGNDLVSIRRHECDLTRVLRHTTKPVVS